MSRLLAPLAFALFCLLPAAPAADQEPEQALKEHLDIRYAPGGADRHLLDVFQPEGASKAPVLVVVHGGFWMIGDKNFFGLYRRFGQNLARQGLVTVMVNYRLSPWVKHPEHAKDAAKAFSWVRQNIDKYGGDPERLVLCGHSAGGHISGLPAADPSFLDEADRKVLRGVIGISGVYRIPEEEEFAKMAEEAFNLLLRSMGPKGGTVPLANIPGFGKATTTINPFRYVFPADRDARTQASPVTHARNRDLPPFVLLHAEYDLPRLPEQATEFSQALKEAKHSAEVMEIKDRNHDTIFFWAYDRDDPVTQAVLKFVEKHARR